MLRLTIFLLSISLGSRFAFTQSSDSLYNWNFYKYLKENHLEQESYTWLKTFPFNKSDTIISDKINTEIAFLFLHINQPDSSNNYFKRLHYINDSALLQTAISLSIIVNDTIAARKYISENKNLLSHKQEIEYNLIVSILKGEQLNDTSSFSVLENELRLLANTYYYFEEKSAFAAGIQSAIIPGLGKRYLGYKKQARSAFIINGVLLAAAIESLLIGTIMVNTYISIPLFTVFYVGNIWGTVQLSKKRTIDFKNQLNEDIHNYYRNSCQFNRW